MASWQRKGEKPQEWFSKLDVFLRKGGRNTIEPAKKKKLYH